MSWRKDSLALFWSFNCNLWTCPDPDWRCLEQDLELNKCWLYVHILLLSSSPQSRSPNNPTTSVSAQQLNNPKQNDVKTNDDFVWRRGVLMVPSTPVHDHHDHQQCVCLYQSCHCLHRSWKVYRLERPLAWLFCTYSKYISASSGKGKPSFKKIKV